jgi:23S rRNA (uracil1939-C5)-methyltransferase
MAVPLPPIGAEVELAIESIAGNGKGKGRAVEAGLEQVSFFVDGTVPGDRVQARVTGGHKRYVEADLIEILSPGPARIEPSCPHYADCGGCQLLHVSYDAQLAAKRDNLQYIFRRRGLDAAAVREVVPSPRPLRYRVRNSLALTVTGEPGMQQRRSHELTAIGSCDLMRPELAETLLPACRLFHNTEGPRPDGAPLRVKGVLDLATGRVYLHPYRDPLDLEGEQAWYEAAAGRLISVENPLCEWRAGDHTLRYAPDCFTQVNPAVNERLVAHVMETLGIGPQDHVLELYAGIGNFTLPIAARAAEVTAVERQRAIGFARRNAQAAGFTNIRFLAAEVLAALTTLAGAGERLTRVLLDPPREGLGVAGCRLLGRLSPARIVYVACDPLTLASDLQELVRYGYRLTDATLFDMFPQTFHFETCATLE